ncbi:MAG: bifunctional pyr operon transcriptional regulator/uracil phosphoribosyltransferase PyrR [Pseudomonadota bacterium]
MTTLPSVSELLSELASQINGSDLVDPVFVGIHTGGVWVAQALMPMCEVDAPLGTLDISFYRDDFSRVGLNPKVRSSQLPIDIEDRELVLVDDVLHTGRTVRAALNEIFSFGRPSRVTLAVLVERPGRELPVTANFSALSLPIGADEHIVLSKQKDSLSLAVVNAKIKS